MAYPSGVNFRPASPVIGSQPIDETSATQRHPLGCILKAFDFTYGEGEFIYLKGVASTAPGDFVFYDTKLATTVRGVRDGVTSVGPAAVAMSANIAGQYGWYAIQGSVPVAALTVVAGASVFLSLTDGTVDDLVGSGRKIDGAVFTAADSGGFAVCQVTRPCLTEEPLEGDHIDLSALVVNHEGRIEALENPG